MSETVQLREPSGELEAMIAAAAGYVRASDDLRPRILEAARTDRRARRGRKHVWQFAAAIVLSCLFTNSAGRRLEAPERLPLGAWGAVGQRAIYEHAEARAIRCGGFSWGVVEAFLDLRRSQSRQLHLTL